MDEPPQLKPRPTLLGMRLYGPPISSDVSVQFGPGLTAFYGRNGAGKTSILNALRNAFAGRAKYITQLIMQADHGSVAYDWVVRSIKDNAPPASSYELRYQTEDVDVIRHAILQWFRSGGRYFDPSLSTDELDPTFIDELTKLTSIAVLPAGGVAPSWEVWLCMPPHGSRAAACDEAATRLVNLWREEDERVERLTTEEEQLEAQYDAGAVTEEEYDKRHSEIEAAWKEAAAQDYDSVYEPVAAFAWDWPWSDESAAVRRHTSRMLGDGLPVPVAKLFTTGTIPFELEDDEDKSDLDRATAVKLMARLDSRTEEQKKDQATDELLRHWVGELESDVNSIYSTLLQDAPLLTLEMSDPSRWLTEKPLQWIVRYGHEAVPLTSLSRAEGRWGRIAIRRALDFESSIVASVIDEPEAALHRAAERHMSIGIEALTTFGPQLITATHSPEVLNSSATSCIHVSKTGGKTCVGQIPDLRTETLENLGLSPSDLLGLYRIFLLVEGVHDEIVLRTFCGPALDEARVKIVPMHGAKKLPGSIESQVLFDLTDAHIVAVLDDIRIQEVNRVWDEAVKLSEANELDSAMTHLTSAFRGRKGNEYEWITNWLARALKRQVASRVEPYGFQARDIIEYLPVKVLVPKARKSWADLREEHDQEKASLDKARQDFKQWLIKTYKADMSVSAIQRGADAATGMPEEFRKFSYRIREIGSRRSAVR
ncbi:AAA family ATPase [Paenarthrobacter ureafaciens]|uniref:AAA family ATPase n=1 Tax=Paenarthrobacter ureafaciens TaxID=37931 RepID=UPI003CF4E53D